jgi:hypothetical protein
MCVGTSEATSTQAHGEGEQHKGIATIAIYSKESIA